MSENKKVLAIVAGIEITEGDVNLLASKLPAQQQAYAQNPQMRAQLLQQLIDAHLYEQKAKDEKLDETENFKVMLEATKSDLMARMAMMNVINAVKLEDGDGQAYYEKNKAQFITGETVSAKHILTETEEECNKAANEIANNEKTFEDAAKEYSTCPSKEQGGNLGTFGRGQMVKEFEDAAFDGELNKVLGPVKTQFGYHLIYVYEKHEADVKPYEEVKAQADQMALQQKQEAAFAKEADELAKKYGLERFDQ